MFVPVVRRFRTLDPGQRARWAALPLVGMIAAGLEALAGAVVFALITILFAPAADPSTGLVGWLRSTLPFATSNSPVLPLAMWAAGVHILKTVLAAGAAWWRVRLAAIDAATLSARLLRGYLAAPWTFHLQRQSSALIERLRDGVRPFFDVLEGAALIVADAALIAGLAIVALLAAPWPVTALMAALTLTVAIALRLARQTQLRGGARLAEFGASLYRHIQHGLGAVKEATILGRRDHFARAYERDAQALAALEARRAFLAAVPRLVVETAFVLGMLALLVAAGREGEVASALPIAGLYAYIGFRVAPAAHRLALQVEQLRWSIGASAPLLDDLEAHSAPSDQGPLAPAPRLEFREVLKAEDVSFAYSQTGIPILRGVTLEIRRGESVAITGPTGAGKSTLVDLLIGLLDPVSGTVTVDGVPVAANLRGWQANIGYVPQVPFFLDDTIRRNIALGVPDDEIDEAAVRRAATLAGLDGTLARLPASLDTTVGESGIRLSGGERQRVAIARALYRAPALVVFDEATSSLDVDTEREVADAIDALRGDRTLIVVAHRPSTIARCDRAFSLQPADTHRQPSAVSLQP